MNNLPPAIIMMAGAMLAFAVPNRLRGPLTVMVPMLALGQMLWVLEAGDSWSMDWLSLELMPLRVDRLSLVFGFVFALTALVGGLFAWHKHDRSEQASALVYGAAALGEGGLGKLDPGVGAVAEQREHHHGFGVVFGKGLLEGAGEGLGGIGNTFLFGPWDQLEARFLRGALRFFFRTTDSNPRTR